jgi:flagellar M-ring protein FliF
MVISIGTVFAISSCASKAQKKTADAGAQTQNCMNNMEYQRSVEQHLEKQLMRIFDGVLGPNKARVKISADLNLVQIIKENENCEMNRDVAQIISDHGAIKKLVISVLVDGVYERDSISGQKIYKPRSEEEIDLLTKVVKNSVGFSQERNDNVCVRSFKAEEFANASMENICDTAIEE